MNSLNTFFVSVVALCGIECQAQTVSGSISGYDYVDLGLSSKKLWATYNVGATAPTEYGSFFAWGEVKPKEIYNYQTYKYVSGGNDRTFTKYCTHSYYGTVDGKLVLEAGDDAAIANWGEGWRMPTTEEQKELTTGCIWEDVIDYNGSGVNGKLGTSKTNGNTIFLPYAGYRKDKSLKNVGSEAHFWSSSVYSNNSDEARTIVVYVDYYLPTTLCIRPEGHNVRAIASGKVAGDVLVYNNVLMCYSISNGVVHIANAKPNCEMQVFDMGGNMVASDETDGNGTATIALRANAIYVVTIGNQSMKVIVK